MPGPMSLLGRMSMPDPRWKGGYTRGGEGDGDGYTRGG